MRTTLTLDDDVFEKLKQETRKSGQPFKQTVNETLRRGLVAARKRPPQPPFRVQARDLGLRPGFQLDNIGELLEQVEGPTHR